MICSTPDTSARCGRRGHWGTASSSVSTPTRPSVVEDRAAVLLALECVDAVVLFDEDTPQAVLKRLRPDVFAKGGDYSISELPEAKLLEGWDGRAVILPYVAGRSTTRLIEEVASRGVR